MLYSMHAFLVNKNLLKVINLHKVGKIIEDNSNGILEFGIYANTSDQSHIMRQINKTKAFCETAKISHSRNLMSLITSFSLSCNNYVNIRINVFYKKNTYLWIGDSDDTPSKESSFGDVQRAISK